ncbi:hypothetical protein U6J79_11745, partial [Cutibacterium acnes]
QSAFKKAKSNPRDTPSQTHILTLNPSRRWPLVIRARRCGGDGWDEKSDIMILSLLSVAAWPNCDACSKVMGTRFAERSPVGLSAGPA